MTNKIIFLMMPLVLMGTQLSAQSEGRYREWLRQELQQNQGVTGGEWMIAATEPSTISRSFTYGQVEASTKVITGQPFQLAREYDVTGGDNPWNTAAIYNPASDIDQGDVVLFVCWVLGITSEFDAGQLTIALEQNSEPFTKSLLHTAPALGEWTQLYLPFEAVQSHPASATQLSLQLGGQVQKLQIGGVALLNFGSSVSLDQLPNSNATYVGRDQNASWRIDAQQRIEQIRKADFAITVLARDSTPVPEAKISFEMQNHHFGFGSAIAMPMLLRNDSDAQTYRQKVADLTGDGRTFSTAVFENAMKWGAFENNFFAGTPDQVAEELAWMQSLGMTIRGHNVIWPGWQFLPDEMQQRQADIDFLRNAVQQRVSRVMSAPGINGEIIDWDVVNEPLHARELLDVLAGSAAYADDAAVLADWLNLAAQADSVAKLTLNDYAILSLGGYNYRTISQFIDLVRRVEAAGARVDGIGLQAHMASTPTAPARLIEILDQFAALGKEIKITEYDTPGMHPDVTADYMRDFLTAMFSHSSVDAFLMWGFWDGAHWFDEAPLFDINWNLKPAGEAFIDQVFEKWWSRLNGDTDEAGKFAGRGFKGEYLLRVEKDGASQSYPVSVVGQTDAVVVFDAVQTDVSELNVLQENRIGKIYPNPAKSVAQLPYRVKRAGKIDMQIFDVAGRRVLKRTEFVQSSGQQSLRLDVSGLPNGVYLFQVRGDEFAETGRLLVLR